MPNGLVAAIHRKMTLTAYCGAVSDFLKVFSSETWDHRVQLPNLALLTHLCSHNDKSGRKSAGLIQLRLSYLLPSLAGLIDFTLELFVPKLCPRISQ